MASLFDPFRVRGVEFDNRIVMSPMCMYSAEASGEKKGVPTDFHVGHYGARAAGGVGLVLTEATAVADGGQISPWDLGLWNDAQTEAFARIADEVHARGAKAGVQIAHAGRKASTAQPWNGGGLLAPQDGGWTPVAPSAVAFPKLAEPRELTAADLDTLVDQWAASARRAVDAGFDVIEIHAAHGYLLHEFLSPVANRRTDDHGGGFEQRVRFPLRVIDAVRAAVGDGVPVFLRLSMTDWVHEADGSPAWTVDEAVEFSRLAHEHGVDLIDASSGGMVPVEILHDLDYQTRHAARLRHELGRPVGAVGRIRDAERAEEIIATEGADLVFIGRALLEDPSWANHAAVALGAQPRYIDQYGYAIRRRP